MLGQVGEKRSHCGDVMLWYEGKVSDTIAGPLKMGRRGEAGEL